MWLSFTTGLLSLQLERIHWGKVWEPSLLPSPWLSPALLCGTPSYCLGQQISQIRKRGWERSQVCDDFFFLKMQIMLCYLNSEVQLYFALISSIQCFDLNLAEGVYLHWGTNPIFTMLTDGICLHTCSNVSNNVIHPSPPTDFKWKKKTKTNNEWTNTCWYNLLKHTLN